MEWVILSATGRLAWVELGQSAWDSPGRQSPTRADHDAIAAIAPTRDHYVAAVTSLGAAHRIDVESLPRLVPGGPWSLWDSPTPGSLLDLRPNEAVVSLFDLDLEAPPLALGTRSGVVKRVVPEYKGWESWEVMAVKDGDAIVGGAHASDSDEIVFVTDDAQLLRLSSREVRPQGRPAGGMAGMKIAEGASVIFFGVVSKADRERATVATLATGPDSTATIKLTGFTDYPAKGRATSGVRTHRFLKGQDHLALAWVGVPPVKACDANGGPRNTPNAEDRRDGTGTKVYGPFFAFG